MGFIKFEGPARAALVEHGSVLLRRIDELLERIKGRPEEEVRREIEGLEFVSHSFVICNGTRAGWAAQQLMVRVRHSGLKPATVAALRRAVRIAEDLDERQRLFEVARGDRTRVRRQGVRRFPRYPVSSA